MEFNETQRNTEQGKGDVIRKTATEKNKTKAKPRMP
jgi:hypothetical protein